MARERRGRETEKLSGRDALIQDGEEAGDATEGIFLAGMRRRGLREGAWEAWRGGAVGVASGEEGGVLGVREPEAWSGRGGRPVLADQPNRGRGVVMRSALFPQAACACWRRD